MKNSDVYEMVTNRIIDRLNAGVIKAQKAADYILGESDDWRDMCHCEEESK